MKSLIFCSIVFILSTSILRAESLVTTHLDHVLAKTSIRLEEKIIDAVVLEINRKLKKNADHYFKKMQKDMPNTSQFKKEDIERMKAVKHGDVIHFYYTPEQYATISLNKLDRNIVLINGKEFRSDQSYTPQQAYEILKDSMVQKNHHDKNKLLSFLISPAHAMIGAMFYFTAMCVIAPIDAAVSAVPLTLKSFSKSNDEQVVLFEHTLKLALARCKGDRERIRMGKDKGKIEKTIEFIHEINKISKRISKSSSKKNANRMLSCKNIKAAKGEKVKSLIADFHIYTKAGKMCDLAMDIEICLKETEIMLGEKGIEVNNSNRTSTDPYVPYQEILNALGPGKTIAR